MELPSAYELLTQRVQAAHEPSAQAKAVAYLSRVPSDTLWDGMSIWRSGFVYATLHQVTGHAQVDAESRRFVQDSFCSQQQADGTWVDCEAPDSGDAGPTAMGLLVLSLMDRSENDQAINLATAWLLGRQGTEGCWVSESSALDDVLAETALVVAALESCGRPDVQEAIYRGRRFLDTYCTDEFLSSDRCRLQNAFVLTWLLKPAPTRSWNRSIEQFRRRLTSPAVLPSALDTARTIATCLRIGVSPYDPQLQSALGSLLLTQRSDGSWPGHDGRNAPYVTAHVLHCLPAADFRISLGLTAQDLLHYQEGLARQRDEEREEIRTDVARQLDDCQRDKAIMQARVQSVESERDLYLQRYMLHIEQHEEHIKAVGRLMEMESERTLLRTRVEAAQKEADRWQTYFWFVLAVTVSIITGLVVNLVTSR